ncbi:MAG TPA: response regulator [Proteobacteria bacterium]|nr:response regulator [Pseudomonadota bacterium]
MTHKKVLVLVVEDEPDISGLISYNLEKAGLEAARAQDGRTALSLIQKRLPDLILLDLMLPDTDGTDICKSLKSNEKTRHIPVIMVTAKGEEIDRVVGFELGADDYIVKPFSPRELVLRVKAVLQRSGPRQPLSKILDAAGIKVDLERHLVTVDGIPVSLTVTEFNLLHTLLKGRGRVLTREILLDQVWGYHFDGYARTVDTHIKRLRQKLGAAGQVIETVRGVGYRFKEESSR